MKKKMLKKSEVLREGYVRGLKEAHSIITKMLKESYELPDSYVVLAFDEDDAKGKVEEEFGETIDNCVIDEMAPEEVDPDLELKEGQHAYQVYNIVWHTPEDDIDWGAIQQAIGYAVADELGKREYDGYYDLKESGQLEEIFEIVEKKIREQYGLGYEIEITDDINDHIKHQTGL